MLAPHGSKLGKFVNHRVSISINDKRRFIGQLLGFDIHSNIVLKDCEEYRQLKNRKPGGPREIKRNIGLMILRGDSVVHVDVIGPPPPTGNKIATSTSSTTHQPGVPHDKNASAQKSTNMPKPAQTTGIVNSSMKAAPSVLPPSALPQ